MLRTGTSTQKRKQTKHPGGGADYTLRSISRPNHHCTNRLQAVELGPMPTDEVVITMDRKKADALEEILDEKSWRLNRARKPGAKPGPKENLVNSILHRVIRASPVPVRA